jgi:tetratricopeptide (TPR) repeat protein
MIGSLFWLSLESSLAATLKIKTEPEGAEIYLINPSAQPVRIGQAPYESNLDEFVNNFVKAESFLLEIRKAGHIPYRVLLARTTQVNLELTANLELDPTLPKYKEHDLLMNQLFDVQKMIRTRNFKDAISRLDELEKTHPKLSIIVELKATAYYMNKEVENALSQYRRAFAINPENIDAYRMKVYLEKKLGVSTDK